MMNVAITVNRSGQPVAYRWSQGRWFRMGLDAAKFAIATGEASRVPFKTWANGQPSAMNQQTVDGQIVRY